jgi:predicted secreted protein
MDTRLHVFGFSEDGRYLAYGVGGHRYGFSYTFGMVKIVEVEKNEYVKDSLFRESEDYEYPDAIEAFIDAAFMEAKPLLRKYSIVEGNVGQIVFERTEKTSWDERIKLSKEVAFRVCNTDNQWDHYTVVLTEQEVAANHCDDVGVLQSYDLVPRIFTLLLQSRGWTKLLQKDSVLYRSRYCPYAYDIYSIYVYGDRIAVFLNNYNAGFEGDDIYRLVVTGTLYRNYLPNNELKE